jgi:hypothetical protein
MEEKGRLAGARLADNIGVPQALARFKKDPSFNAAIPVDS